MNKLTICEKSLIRTICTLIVEEGEGGCVEFEVSAFDEMFAKDLLDKLNEK